jgi:ribosome-associated heat shock protein Hsp15
MPSNLGPTQTLRIDKWLWHARFCKTRALAQVHAEKGHIRVNGRRIEKAGARIRPGDIVTLAFAGQPIVIRVLGLGGRRGAAIEARTLYEIIDNA